MSGLADWPELATAGAAKLGGHGQADPAAADMRRAASPPEPVEDPG